MDRKISSSRLLRPALASLVLVTAVAAVPASAIELCPAEPAAFSELKAAPDTVYFDHSTGRTEAYYNLELAPEGTLKVVVDKTCKEAFTYASRGIPLAPGITPSSVAGGCAPSCVVLPVKHDKANGGYIVEIVARTGVTTPVALTGGASLTNAQLVIDVDTRAWEHEYAGAFTFSKVVDPKFGLDEREMDGEMQSFLIQDREAEDEADTGVAAFVHVIPPWRWLRESGAITFGLGLDEDTDPTYHAGFTWRWKGQGGLTLGYAWGEVDALPAGTRFDRPVDSGILGQLQRRTEGDWFFALSYTFLRPGDALQKPFVPAKAASKPGQGTGGGGTGGSAGNDGSATAPPTALGRPVWKDFPQQTSGDSVLLTWNPGAGATKHQVKRADGGCDVIADGSVMAADLAADASSFADRGLEAGKTYAYQVIAVDDSSNAGTSECRQITLAPAEDE